jgi:hypothetical protein
LSSCPTATPGRLIISTNTWREGGREGGDSPPGPGDCRWCRTPRSTPFAPLPSPPPPTAACDEHITCFIRLFTPGIVYLPLERSDAQLSKRERERSDAHFVASTEHRTVASWRGRPRSCTERRYAARGVGDPTGARTRERSMSPSWSRVCKSEESRVQVDRRRVQGSG